MSEPPRSDLQVESSGSGAPARDGDIAVREEFELAERAGTAEAYRLFAARHPNHPLAPTARARADQLAAHDEP